MRLHDTFEWDPMKARSNLRKHGVSFDDAAAVLADDDGDRFHVDEYDDRNSMAEDRWITTGSHPAERSIVLRIAWTERIDGADRITRIITARAASPRERRPYVEAITSA